MLSVHEVHPIINKPLMIHFKIKTLIAYIICILISYIISQSFNCFYDPTRCKTIRENVESVFIVFCLSILTFIFGNYSETFESPTTIINLWIVIPLLITPMVWNFVHEKSNSDLSNISNWKNTTYILYIIVFLFLVLLIGIHFVLAKKNGILIQYSIGFTIVIVIIIILFSISSDSDDNHRDTFHLHHWMVGWLLAFFTRFNNNYSYISAGIALGTFIHGFSIYNDSLILYDCKSPKKNFIGCI